MADNVAPTKNFLQVLSVSGAGFGTTGAPNVTTPVKLGAINQGELYVQYNQDTLTKLNILVEVSNDGVTWFQKTVVSSLGAVTAQTWTLAATGNLVIDLPLLAHGQLRLRVFGSGTAASDDSVTISLGGGSI
jgi:hypothetical protein